MSMFDERHNMVQLGVNLDELVKVNDPYIRAYIAALHADKYDRLLAKDTSSAVRNMVAQHSTRIDVLSDLMFDSSPVVSQSAVNRLYELKDANHHPLPETF